MNKRIVLFIEDDVDDVALTLLAFKDWGFPFEVHVARDGEQALAYLRGLPRKSGHAGVITDLNIPRISGLDFIKRARASAPTRGLPIVVLTSSDDPQDIARARALGASDYVIKPLSYKSLEPVVRRLTAIFERGAHGDRTMKKTRLKKPRAPRKVLLRLYVAGQTGKSIAAIKNLRRLCEERIPGRYTLEIIDLVKNPRLAAGDQIVAIPTLVRRLPPPMRKIIGDLSDSERVIVGLQLA